MANLLADATSPYLRQHADNPVHWQQWSPDALAEAARRNVPILLSIGYAACHWCHVMAHESFEDDDVAAVANANFVCIKVDREERPDLDTIYMNATVALTGQGGWPMTCFLTPTGEPFFCGTYYPKAAFLQLLSAVTEAWTQRRDDVDAASGRIAEELRRMADGLPGGPPISAELCQHAVSAVLGAEDIRHGGFGGAPKFPPSSLLEALLREHERTGSAPALAAVERTATAMARGGIYDQLAGGFARYAVDIAWVVPHFEKMLYDNALLLNVYAHWARRTGSALAARIAGETADFLLRDLAEASGSGLFISSLDADADGREGSSYVWTPEQLAEVLGDDDGRWAAEFFTVTAAGTFEHGESVLQRLADPDTADEARLQRVRAALLAARGSRVQPGRDDKIVTAWNALAISGLLEAAVALERPDLLAAANRCADALLELHLRDGRLRRASLGGTVGGNDGVLEDYAALADALLALYQHDGDPARLAAATGLLDTALAHFADAVNPGGWFDVADDAEQLLMRPATATDDATPSGASLITGALLSAAHLVDGAARYQQAAAASLQRYSALLSRAPRAAGRWLAVAQASLAGPLQIAVACDDPGSPLLAAARRLAPGGAVVVGGPRDSMPLLAERGRIDGGDAAYVCRGRICDLPVTTPEGLAAALSPPV